MFIGKALRRDEDYRFLTGRGSYTADIFLPGIVHAAFVHSPHTHARIKRIDKSAARTMPGVLAVLSDEEWQAEGLGVLPTVHPVDYYDGRPINVAPRPVFASETVCYVGDNVAVVIAETAAQSLDAAEAVEVDYEPLPSIVDTARCLDADAALVHEEFGTNEAEEWRLGDKAKTDVAFAKADHVTELTLVSNRITGNPIEPRTYLGHYDQARDQYTMWVSGQLPHWYRQWICRDALFLPEHKVRVVCPDVGGGFGTKAFF